MTPKDIFLTMLQGERPPRLLDQYEALCLWPADPINRFLRSGESERQLVCACNFIPNEHRDFLIGLPEKGTLREILTSDDTAFGGEGRHNKAIIESGDEGFCDLPYSARINLPPLSCVYFEFIPERNEEDEKGI